MSKNLHSCTKAILLLLPMLFFTQDAHASYPMIIDMEMGYVILFIPIVLLKAWVFKKYLPKVGYGKLIGANAASNAFSTVIAVPITWWLLYKIELYLLYKEVYMGEPYTDLFFKLPHFLVYIIQTPCLGYADSNWIGALMGRNDSHFYVPIVVAAMILLIPFFFVSVWTEGWINKKFFKSEDPKHMQRITRTANLLSYGFFYIIVGVSLAYILWKY